MGRLRLYHSMYQLFNCTMLVALLTNNMGILWVAMEAATLTTVLLVSLYRTPASLEAAWKYFILCGVGIAQALFGTILLYFAAEKLLGAGGGALLWTELDDVKSQLEPTVLSIAFVFLLVGYGTKVGLVPLHNWLPDAHAEGPTPVSAVLSGLLLNVALYAVVRCKVLVEGSLQTSFARDLMMGFGLLSVVVAALLLSRQKDVKRLFAYSSVEHMGIITFAFGMGGPVANFAALLHMTVHSLTKSAIFFTVGHAAQKTGTQIMDEIRGLITIEPDAGLGAHPRHAGHPRDAAVRRLRERVPDPRDGHQRAALGRAVPARRPRARVRRGLLESAADGVRRHDGQAAAGAARDGSGLSPPGARADARALDSAVPRRLVPAGGAAHRIGQSRMDLSRLGFATAVLPAAVPARRCPVNAMGLLSSCRVAWEQGAHLVALWGSDDRDRDRGYTLHVVVQDAEGLVMFELTLPTGDSTYPDLAVVFPAANRMQRATFDLLGLASEGDDQRPWVWQASWPIDQFPLRRDFEALAKWQPGQEEYAFVRVEGDGVHEIPVGPVHAGIIEPGHFRFQVVGEKVLRLEERLSFVHKGIEKRFEAMSAATGHRLAGRVSGDSTVAYAWAYAQALEAICGTAPPIRAALAARARAGARAHRQSPRRSRLSRQRRRLRVRARAVLAAEGARAAHESRTLFGHRLAMDWIVPGGVARDLAPEGAATIGDECAMLEREVRVLRDIYDEHDGLQDRFRACGVVTPELARKLGLIGLAGRASGQARDLRCDFPTPPYDALAVRKAAAETGDVAARVAVRFDEI